MGGWHGGTLPCANVGWWYTSGMSNNDLLCVFAIVVSLLSMALNAYDGYRKSRRGSES